jgi:hypothetical protein
MGYPETYLADMRVFDYIGHSQVPKDLVRVDDKKLMRYLEWRIERLVDFHKELRDRLEKTLGRKLIFTSNGNVGIAEQSAVMIKSCFDMIFSEDGFNVLYESSYKALKPTSNASRTRQIANLYTNRIITRHRGLHS